MRMRDRQNRKWFLIYPEDRFKTYWDLIVAVALIVTCSITPVRLAFYDDDSTGWRVFNEFINIVFGIDIIVIFFTAIYNDDFVLIEDIRTIAGLYVRGWFLLDLLAIFPFEAFTSSSG